MKPKLLSSILASFTMLVLQAQNDSASTVLRLKQLSLEELMDISIYSVSKIEESTFDAPLSSTVLTRGEIKKAGCTTIMEALRLVPGVIVREQSNGNYDIHIRGLDNVPPNLGMYFFTNSTTLVMIDSRPVYNYVQGGTFWETLPIDLNDVEQIEVVRGPSSAMYGPNAVSGVINIITRKPQHEGIHLVGNGQYGNYNTGIANTAIDYQYKDKFSIVVSGNFQTRERTGRDYYISALDTFVPLQTFLPDDSIMHAQYPHPKLSMRKYGYNGFINYKINDKASIALSGGGQHSEVQNLFASTFLTTAQSNTYYVNLIAKAYGLNFQGSHLTGNQTPQAGASGAKWNFNTTDLAIDYNITQIKHIVITPGLSFRRQVYDDRDYVDEAKREGGFNGKVELNTTSATLRVDAKMFKEKLRLLAAGRMDRFNTTKKLYFSWEFALTYKVNDKHIIRAVASRANQAPLMLNNYFDVLVTTPNSVVTAQLLGNKDLKLLTTDMVEVGYRGKISDKAEIDLEIFASSTKNFYNQIFSNFDTTGGGFSLIYRFHNIPLVAKQIGGTLSFTLKEGIFSFRPFITAQYTRIYNYSPYPLLPTAPLPGADTANINTGIGTSMRHVATPTVFGGADINFEVTRNFNLNMNAYFMSKHTQLEEANRTYNDGKRGVENISPKFILNVVASYTFLDKLTLFMNFRNIINENSREFFRGDIPYFRVSGGINFEF